MDEDVLSVQVPGEDGSFGILPRHASMTALTDSGLLKVITANNEVVELIIHDGFAQIKGNVVTVLTRSAENPQDIDLNRAREAAKRAQKRLGGDRKEYDSLRAQASLRRALMREKLSRS